MKTLEEAMARCRVENDHWIWTGAMSAGVPRVYAPDLDTGRMAAQSGRRATWQMVNGKIKRGYWVYGSCDEPNCINPAHCVARLPARQGETVARSGRQRGKILRVLVNRKIGRSRSVLTPALLAEIRASTEKGVELSRRLGISKTVISRARRGATAFDPIGPFGLIVSIPTSTERAAS